MGDGLFGISISGLRAAQIGLSTTGHNITNASTSGFHRQEIIQSTNNPLQTGAGFIGQGVTVDTVRRVYSAYLDNQVKPHRRAATTSIPTMPGSASSTICWQTPIRGYLLPCRVSFRSK